ncbi:hypothetical protein [Streptomyces rubellomurinus]|nr:hypothetical protein [Streptomyces rubellomurinus]
MRVVLTRASVCMADDCDAPHEAVWETPDGGAVADVLERSAGYLLSLNTSCWVAYLGYGRGDGRPLAVASPRWSGLRLLPDAEAHARLGPHADRLEIYWAVRSGADPEVVWWELTGRRGPRPRPQAAPAPQPEALRLRLRDHRDQLIRRIRLG